MEHQSIEPLSYLNPNYSQPEDSQKLLQFLFEDIDMWRRFEDFAFSIKRKEGITNFIPWLFSEKTEIPKWVLLFNEWLCLEETIERFGTMICPDCNGKGSFSIGSFTCDIQTCATCMGTGKTLTLWAEEVKKQPPNLTAGEFNRSE